MSLTNAAELDLAIRRNSRVTSSGATFLCGALFDPQTPRRLFDVVLEGETRIESLNVLESAGFATAFRKDVEVEVDDGFLDLGFHVRSASSMISAIEIEPASEKAADR